MRIILYAVLATGVGIATTSQVVAQQHDHPTASNAAAKAPARRFATDAVLREDMRGIRKAVGALGHYEQGHVGPEQVALLAGNIESHVNDIIANCKLPPDADAALHAVIVPLMGNAATLKADPAKTGSIAAMRDALAQYRSQFDDPELDLED